MQDRTDLIKKIHESKYKITYVSSGGGTNAISSLLRVPGASNTILETYVPYSKKSMDLFLNKKPDHYCSLNTCLSMSANAYKKSIQIEPETKTKYLIGIAVTASLATTYKKIGDHKFFVVMQTDSYTKTNFMRTRKKYKNQRGRGRVNYRICFKFDRRNLFY
jgi:nicotinamide mononucleotide (NMN) deamidase PncC